jgi:hypothetical protein
MIYDHVSINCDFYQCGSHLACNTIFTHGVNMVINFDFLSLRLSSPRPGTPRGFCVSVLVLRARENVRFWASASRLYDPAPLSYHSARWTNRLQRG